jgi:hypothetical protein
MISKTAEQMWGVALLMLSPGYLVDKFLDWVEEFRDTMLPAYVDRPTANEVRAEERLAYGAGIDISEEWKRLSAPPCAGRFP